MKICCKCDRFTIIKVARNPIQRIRSPVLIRSLTDVSPQIETFLSGVLMIYENKQGNLVCYKLYEHK